MSDEIRKDFGVTPEEPVEKENNELNGYLAEEANGSAPKNENAPETEEMALDDARRVKAMSPGMLVARRFFRNRLAMVGLWILIILFLFCFIGPVFYPYSESDVFTTRKEMRFDYAFAKINLDYYNVFSKNKRPGTTFVNMMNSYIAEMKSGDLSEKVVADENGNGKNYLITKKTDEIYTVEFDDVADMGLLENSAVVGSYVARGLVFNVTLNESNQELLDLINADYAAKGNDVSLVSVNYNGSVYTLSNRQVVCTYPGLTEKVSARAAGVTDEIIETAKANLGSSFTVDGVTYEVTAYTDGGASGYNITAHVKYLCFASTTLNLDRYDAKSGALPDEFRLATLIALGDYDETDPSTASYVVGEREYNITERDDELVITYTDGDKVVEYVSPSVYSIRRYTGEDTISIATKMAFREVIDEMIEEGLSDVDKKIKMEAIDENGDYIYDDDGNVIFAEDDFRIETRDKGQGQQFVFRNVQEKTVADINADPSSEHVLGLDGNAMDVLARIMYGGRISLLIGFIVVFIEIILGSIMGGISGYFGGWVDNLIMRIVDIFYCIPTLPILIILGSVFDQMKMPNLERVIWMMAVLGFLGWPGIARIVRGQILSLREQDFMIAAEASGLTASRKIRKHLIPNVIPQLIVQATMGLGGVIITESTLSFLGLGVKFPMATWGQIINSVSSINDMKTYTYIWVPVGGLICLAVIAFNFVGDGLRDAFDPKMNR